jgi:hypothetical protein
MSALLLARVQAHDLLRRRLALALLISMPLAFFLVTFTTEKSDHTWSSMSGAIGLGFAVAGAAFFAMLAGRGVDPRLVLAEWRPWQLIAGRLLMLYTLAAVIGAGFLALMWLLWAPPKPAALILAIVATALVSVPVGLAVAAVLPRELEGTLIVIVLIGMQMSVPTGSSAGPYTPLWGAQRLTEVAAKGGDLVTPVLHALGWAAAVLLVAALAWRRRLRINRPAKPPWRRSTVDHARADRPGDTMNASSASQARQTMPALRLWRTSAIMMWVIAAGFGLPAVPVAVYLLRRGQLPWFFDLFPMYGGPVDGWVGPTGYAFLILLFGGVALAETAIGVLLCRGKRAGAILSLALLPVEIAFWTAFALPIPPIWAAVRLTLTLWAWSRTRGNAGPLRSLRLVHQDQKWSRWDSNP